MKAKEKILSGVQPTGKLHIGNYLGALRNFVKLQNSNNYDCFFMIADYHSITEDYDPETKQQQIIDLALDFLAIGLDPKKSTIFLQSMVPEHLELSWIFSTITPVSELARMTQYKDKAVRQEKNINVGLFTYPILQAVDILIYHPQLVPVGEDQVQHLELTNLIARIFNRRYGETFQPIKPMLTLTPRVMSLKDPDKKMSKSDTDGCIFLTDEPKTIEEKLKKALTDTAPEGSEKSPGVKNLFLLLENFGDVKNISRFRDAYENKTIRYAELKFALANSISSYFASFREVRKKLAQKPEAIKKMLLKGSNKAQMTAGKTLKTIRQKIGLVF